MLHDHLLEKMPHHLSLPRGWDLGLKIKITFYVSYLSFLCNHEKFGLNVLTTDLYIAKFKYLTFDPAEGFKGWWDWVKF